MTQGDGLTSATYNAMDKPTQKVKSGKTLNFTYGPQYMRFKQVNGNVTTYYSDKLYEEEINGTKTIWRAYIDDIAVISQTTNEGATIRYTQRDRLGSVRVFTDHNGQVEAERNFDPFGKPRLVSGGLKPFGASKLSDVADAKTRRGFTDHEHLDNVGLIYMNGRVYDYNLGRFMSVDPVIQSPTNSQSINPYSYIMNNPLSGTDPTEYASRSVDDAAGCQDVAEDLGKGETADVTQKQSVTGSRIKSDVKVGTMTGNGNGTVNIQIGNMSATADIGAPSTTAKDNNSSGRDLYACTKCFGGSNSIDGVDMPEVIDEYWRERRDGENGYPSTEYLGSRELHHEGLYDGDSEILASGAFETYLNENPRLGLSYNYDLPDAWRMRMPNIVFAPEVKVNVYNVYVNWSIEKTPILDVKIYRQKIRMSSYSNDRKRTFVETRWKYTKEVQQQVDSKIQYFESRRRGGVNQVQSWPIVP